MPWCFILIIWLISPVAWGQMGPAIVGGRPGYLQTVKEERHWRETEMVLIQEPASVTNFGRPFVDEKLTREFQTRYELTFGQTDAERNYNSISRSTFFEYPSGTSENVQTHTKRQRQFAEYMFRRLTEHHVDQYAKSNPEVRPIYELKDRIANVNVQLRRGFKMRLNYSYSGNYLDVKLDNPYNISSKVTLQMAQGGVGPGRVEKTIVGLAYPATKTVTLSSFYQTDDHATTLIGSKRLTPALGSSLTVTSHTLVDPDLPKSSPHHDLVLFGLSWTE